MYAEYVTYHTSGKKPTLTVKNLNQFETKKKEMHVCLFI